MIYAATGHRPHKLGGYSNEVAQRLYELAAGFLAHHKVSWVISGMALGWDMAVAEAATALHIPWTAAIPFHGQEKHWPAESQARYQLLLSFAHERVIVTPGKYKAWKMLARDKWMVENCDRLVALWNGGLDGGTAHTIAFAQASGKPYVNLWDEWEKVNGSKQAA